ncbi:Acid phosphatase/vanadium-dependent haloperoxidase-related protein [Cynara cardunculus var. scolymus]|uniref:Acid phosphatase/vanadium-dependent haloperoxidase-related protein n=1 Tax=Cynara cardunculus var. scolymus TaxID=59895 RepID=A0A103XI49_CYNCS|nr:Acid phosphatase/vanadium-dependent haloperoxidase-related protein [Cynara cardunculus var. scolymus]
MGPVITYPSFHFTTSISRFSFPFTTSNKPTRNPSCISLSSNPQNPTSSWQKYTSPMKKFPILRSVLHGLRTLDDKTSMDQWVSDPDGLSCNYLQNGGIGMVLLSVTSTAKVRFSPFVATLAANPTFASGFFAWLMAQSLKVFLHFCFEKKLDLRIMCASGGMPSSHSALCTALTTSVAICHGVLNVIVEDLFQGHPISKRKLKELLGHTPSQVVAGAMLGILVACFCCQGCFGVI